ncbi:unnamed protein product, partial [marine sediment metagenome]
SQLILRPGKHKEESYVPYRGKYKCYVENYRTGTEGKESQAYSGTG